MTIETMVTEVLNNRRQFPLGWKTDVADFFKSVGAEDIEIREHLLCELLIRKDYEGPAPDTIICRSLKGAIGMMEEDIKTTLANEDGEFDPKQMRRISPTQVIIGNGVEWLISVKQLFD